MTPDMKKDISFPLVAVLGALGFFALLQGLMLYHTGGVFEYPLDDVYIHLAMAEGAWGGGGYGVNAGEYTSAASSALYPFLLVPFGGPEVQRLLPLFWNTVGLIAVAWLWGQLLVAGGYGDGRLRPVGLLLAAFGPVALMASSTAYIGMEHSLHAAASLAILLGLVRHLQGNTPWALLYAGILFSPMLRFEGLALAVLAVLVLFTSGNRKQALIAAFLAVVPLALFCGFLLSLGLDPLPNSVMAKQHIDGADQLNPLMRLIAKFRLNISVGGGMVLLGLVVGTLAMLMVGKNKLHPSVRIVGLVIIAAGASHLFFGKIGWQLRYEYYILIITAGGFLFVLAGFVGHLPRYVIAGIAAVALLVPAAVYVPMVIKHFPKGPRSIHNQQGQMAVFAKDYLKDRVAVNDLGSVAWNNPNYVLDLWGLASSEALKLRLSDPVAGWADQLITRYNVPAAMIYDGWIREGVGADWVLMGKLVLKEPRGFLGGDRVSFYATGPEHVAQMQDALRGWVSTLDPLTYFEYADGMQ